MCLERIEQNQHVRLLSYECPARVSELAYPVNKVNPSGNRFVTSASTKVANSESVTSPCSLFVPKYSSVLAQTSAGAVGRLMRSSAASRGASVRSKAAAPRNRLRLE